MTKIAWIGLGAMGARMAWRLADASHDLTVWNRTPGRADVLAAAGARVAATPADAVRDAEAVFVMLADPAAVRDVTEGPVGIAAGVRAGTVVVDMSTVGPVAVARLLAALPQAATLLDAPVLGSPAEADAGTLTLLVGGPVDDIARMRPLLSILGDLIHLGPTGSGAAAKLVANFALLGTVGMLGEALAIADGLGLPREVTWRVLAHTPLAAQADRRRPVIESGAFAPRFALGLARKDADLIATAADASSVDIRFARAARSWLADAEAAGLGALDYTAVLSHIPSSQEKPDSGATSGAVTTVDVPHYSWGDGCDGWRLVDSTDLSVIEERMPSGTAEQWHVHDRARQFCYVLDGQATMRTLDGEIAVHAGAGVPTTRGDRRPCPAPLQAGEQA